MNQIVNAMNNGRFYLRTIEGLASELNQSPEGIAKEIRNLMFSRKVVEITDGIGNWYYTTWKRYTKQQGFVRTCITAITGIIFF